MEPPVIDINKLTAIVQSIFPAQVLKYALGDRLMNPASSPSETENGNMEKVGLFPSQGKRPDESTNPDCTNQTK